MKIGLIDVDGHNFPNLALMKISAHHKAKGNDVIWWNPFEDYDIVYQSKVFDKTYSRDIDVLVNAKIVVVGGTGYGLNENLPDEIEHIYPDYSLYPQLTKDTAYGFLTRGCPRDCAFCIVSQKEGKSSKKVADVKEFWRGQKTIKLLDPNILACKQHKELLEQLIKTNAYVDFTQGLDARLITEKNATLISQIKIKNIHFAWDNKKDEAAVLRGLKTYAQYAKSKPHGYYGSVYVLVNYNTDFEYDLHRIYTLKQMKYNPYVMVYNKPSADKKYKQLQRWCNNRIIFNSCTFDEYQNRFKREIYGQKIDG